MSGLTTEIKSWTMQSSPDVLTDHMVWLSNSDSNTYLHDIDEMFVGNIGEVYREVRVHDGM